MKPIHLILAVTAAAVSATAEPSRPSGDNVAPASLQQRIASVAEPFGERAGIAVQSVEDGWRLAVNGDRAFQQQSVFKTWVAAVALDAIDRGSLRWDEPIRIERGVSSFLINRSKSRLVPTAVPSRLGSLYAGPLSTATIRPSTRC